MSAFPTLEEYNEAIQHPQAFFTDPELAAGKVKTNAMSLPAVMCGGYTLTYMLQCKGKTYAARCFHKKIKDIEKRYKAISRRLRTLKSDYFVDFEFQNEGIMLGNQSYPLLKMAWARGQTLGTFLKSAYDKPNLLNNLDKSLIKLAAFLESHNISHGDIQPENVMVSYGGKKLRLIDYDGMYLDEISRLGGEELGLRNFQHPMRNRSCWGPHLDRFSFILMHMVLSVLQEEPELWNSTQSDADFFLFRANDYLDPQHSAIFAKIAENPKLLPLLRVFGDICRSDFAELPSLADFAANKVSLDSGGKHVKNRLPASYVGNYPVVSALDYSGCLAHVGDMVELVGKVLDVKKGYTRFRTPYYFINFKDWHGEAVKITIWEDALRSAAIKFKSLKDKFISVVGLLQPPYATRSYSHISLQASESTIIRVITAEEAEYRLQSAKQPVREQIENKDILPDNNALLQQACMAEKAPAMLGKTSSVKNSSAAAGKDPSQDPNGGIAGDNGELLEKLDKTYGNSKLIVKKIKCPGCSDPLMLYGKHRQHFLCKNCGVSFIYDFQQDKVSDIIQPSLRNEARNKSFVIPTWQDGQKAAANVTSEPLEQMPIGVMMQIMRKKIDKHDAKRQSGQIALVFAIFLLLAVYFLIRL